MFRTRWMLALALAVPVVAGAETPSSDPKAIAVADQVMKSLGGKKRWDDLRGIRWSFGAERNDTV